MFAAVFFYAVLLIGAGLILLSHAENPDVRVQIRLALVVAAFLSALLVAVLFLALYVFVLGPLELLSREIRIITGVNPRYVITVLHRHFLGDIPEAVRDLGDAFMKSRREIAEAVSASSSELESSRTRLETILSSLKEGIIVCDERARIMFYNLAARRVMQESSALGLGLSLYQLCTASPIESSLAILRQRRVRNPADPESENSISFVSSTLMGTIISCSIRLLPEVHGLSWSFLLTCEDVSREADARGRRENLMRAAMRGIQTPLTSLRLSVDSIEMLPDLDAGSRAALERTMVSDTATLTAQFEVLAREIEAMESPRYLVSDVYTGDVVACVARQLGERGVLLTMIGDPLWIKAEIHSLLHLLEFFAWKIHEYSCAASVEVETLLGDKRVYFNFFWRGKAVPEALIRQWKSSQIEPPDSQTVSEVLEHLGSEVWSRPHGMPGYAMLCIPILSSTRQWESPAPLLPARPVYTDFSPYEDAEGAGRLKDLPLNRISFVVFDTETTGLAPLEGDEIVSLAGVRIVNRGIVVGETFDRLVNPGRTIPPSSARFHGITDDMVIDKPSIEDVLRSFHAFTGDAVLVGHNTAFDMRFIRMKEKRAGVSFRGPVLDTLALSLFLHDHTPEHSLDAVARRLGVEVRARHTAQGDALITAQIFLKFLFLLQERGINTMAQLMEVIRR
ncbi:MAG: histidine kinase [Nitrospirae bacterium]|nr:histidine kinase [Nitrospirota bacterium]